MNNQLDIGFIKRVYRTSAWVWLFSLLLSLGGKNLHAAIGITVGYVISVGSLMLLERIVTTLFTPEESKTGRRPTIWLMVAAVIKYAIIGVLLWASLKSNLASPAGIAIGVGIPYVVIALKALGMAISFGPETDRRS